MCAVFTRRYYMGSFQSPMDTRSSALLETSCGYLLQELKMIWNEVGEDQFEREKVLLDLEQECLEVYRRKVDIANTSRARLHQELACFEAEFMHLLLSLGERSLPGRPDKMSGTLKEQLDSITPALEEMQLRKRDRVRHFRAVQGQIQKLSAEIAGQSEYDDPLSNIKVNENDLSLKKLEEYQIELQRLHNEKNDRLQRVNNYVSTIQNMSDTLGMDSSMIITKIHPSLNELSGLSKNISDSILTKLNNRVESLEAEKHARIEKLYSLAKALTNLWTLMDTPYNDRQMFSHVTSIISNTEISTPGSFTLDTIQQAEAEVKRLDQLKASKMKELLLKKQTELEEICSRSHMEITSRSEMENIINLINTGEIDHAELLSSMDEHIMRAEEEACSRMAIMEKIEKWVLARDEERWLEEYNRDENRYSVSRGSHNNLKRAERVRLMVNKMPALVDLLIAKTKNWEDERKKVFLYDEVPLLAMMEEYNMLRQEKEEEKQRLREKKKVQGQEMNNQENVLLTRPTTSCQRRTDRGLNGGLGNSSPINRKLSMGIQRLESNSIKSPNQGISFIKEGKMSRGHKNFTRTDLNSHLKDDTASEVSTFSGPISP